MSAAPLYPSRAQRLAAVREEVALLIDAGTVDLPGLLVELDDALADARERGYPAVDKMPAQRAYRLEFFAKRLEAIAGELRAARSTWDG